MARLNIDSTIIAGLIVTGLAGHLTAIATETEKHKPNILLIVSDDLNTCIGPYMEIDRHTPCLDRLASEGVRFTKAYCQYPACGPSRASFMSGLYPETNGILHNRVTDICHINKFGNYRKETPALANHPSMAGFFRQNGYFTARVSKIFHMGVPGGIERGEPGSDDPDSWDYTYNVLAPETYSSGELELLSPKRGHHYGISISRMIIPDELEETQADYMAASQAIAILENRAGQIHDRATNRQRMKSDAPFFLAVGFVRPHVPFIAPENCFVHYPENEAVLPIVKTGENVPKEALMTSNNIWRMNEIQKRRTISSYMASVRFMDQQIGRILDALDRLKLRDKTIVVFLSDQGFMLGEHDCWAKGSLWEESIRVPLILSVPGYGNSYGTSCESIVELIDLYPTLAELCGLADKEPSLLQGNSFAGYISGEKLEDQNSYAYTVAHEGRDATIRTARWRYSRRGEEAGQENEELYDHQNDPDESVNLADNPDAINVVKEMRERFEAARMKARMKVQTANAG